MATRSNHEAGIPPALLREMRPIGPGRRFQPPPHGPVIGSCRHTLGARYGVHVEVFAANLVVLIPAGIGAAPPREESNEEITGARCYGELVTLLPTGVVLVRRGGSTPTIGDLFRSWGQRLSHTQLGGFADGHVRAFVGGQEAARSPAKIPLTPHAEIVLEIGPYVPPHRSFTFPPGI
jgi:hypothetical protein